MFELFVIGAVTSLGGSSVAAAFWILRVAWKKLLHRSSKGTDFSILRFCQHCDTPWTLSPELEISAFLRGTRVRITSGHYAGKTGIVSSYVIQNTVAFPEEAAEAVQVGLDDDGNDLHQHM